MDLTPRQLTEVEFREEWRGYKREDVDDFLERVAAAVGELQERLRETGERASQAERRLLDRSDEDEIRRTLVLAQRTALTAVEEARAEAERIVGDADDRARRQVTEAEARSAAADEELAERTRLELGALAERRAALQADVDALTSFLEEHRTRLRAELERQLAELDASNVALSVPAPPEVSDVDDGVAEPEPEPEAELASEPEPVVVEVPVVEAHVPRAPTEEEVAQAREDLVEALRRAGVEDLLGDAVRPEELTPWAPEAAPQPEPVPDAAPRLYDAADESGELEVPLQAAEATGMYDVLAEDEEGADLEWREQEPEPVPSGDDEDDPFLAELRRAVTDTEPLGPRDVDPVPQRDDDDDDDAMPSGRFRLRRSR
jgi:cell division initiation protein